jgi:hypothetical protein
MNCFNTFFEREGIGKAIAAEGPKLPQPAAGPESDSLRDTGIMLFCEEAALEKYRASLASWEAAEAARMARNKEEGQ